MLFLLGLMLLFAVSAFASTEALGDFVVAPDGSRHVVGSFNATLLDDEIVVFTPAFGPSTATVDAMVEIVVVDGTVVEVSRPGDTNTAIPPDGYVISGHGEAADWLREHFRPGDRVWVLRNEPVGEPVTSTFKLSAMGPAVIRGTDQLVIFTPGRERTGTNPWGFEAVVRDRMIVAVGGNDNAIPPDGFVLSGHGKARDWLASHARVGAVVDVTDSGVSIAVDARSLAYQARTHLHAAEQQILRAQAEGIPLNVEPLMERMAHALNLLAQAEQAWDAGDEHGAFRLATLALHDAESAFYAGLPSRPVEVRGVWYRPVEISPDHVRATLDRLARVGVNVLFLETFYRGRTLYPSEFVAQHEEFFGWDPLAVWIEEGRCRGIDVHLWIHTFRFDDYLTGTLLRDRPDWLASGPKSPVPPRFWANRYSVDPAHAEVRAFVLDLIEEMTTRYRPAGIHLDYVRYPKSEMYPGAFSITDTSRRMFIEQFGHDPLDYVNRRESAVWQAWQQWQEEQITTFVAAAYDRVKSVDRSIVLSAAVVPEIHEARAVTRQNWEAWAERGVVDMLLPMAYNSDSGWVGRSVAAARAITHDRVFIAAGLGVYLGLTPDVLVAQVLAAEEAGSFGASHFALAHVRGAHFDALTAGLYAQPAVPPYQTARALSSLGRALHDSLRLTGGPDTLFRVAEMLLEVGAVQGPQLAEVAAVLAEASHAEEGAGLGTAWQKGLVRQAERVVEFALSREQ